MPFCGKCGTQMPDGSAFCPNCGNKQESAQSNQQPEQPVYTQPVQQPEQPVYAQPVQQPEQPVYQQPMYQQPMYQQPMYQQPEQPKKKSAAKIIIPIVAAVAVIALALVLFFVLKGTPVEDIDMDEDYLTLQVDETYWLTYTIYPSDYDDEITWTSSDEDVATVKNGKITAVGDGTCTITIRAESGEKESVEVEVLSMVSEERAAVGNWDLDFASIDGELVYDVPVYLHLYDDNTGVLTLEGESSIYFTWYYSESDEECHFYDVYLDDGDSCIMFLYYTGEYVGDLDFYVDDTMIFFFE